MKNIFLVLLGYFIFSFPAAVYAEQNQPVDQVQSINSPQSLLIHPKYQNVYADSRLPQEVTILILSLSVFSSFAGFFLINLDFFKRVLSRLKDKEEVIFRPIKLQPKINTR